MNEDYLMHYGVRGMRWGVRRYASKGGSYTRAGLKRFSDSYDTYNMTRIGHKATKYAYKKKGLTLPDGNTITATKADVKATKASMKSAKKQLDKDYKHLKVDYKADKGKARYQSGQTITGRSEAARILGSIGSMTIAGTAYAYKSGLIDSKTTQILGAIGAASVVGSGIAKVANMKGDNELRAYYSHTSKY